MEDDDYEFELSEEQIRNAIKKYGVKHVQSVYRKLMGLRPKELAISEQYVNDKKNENKTKINLGYGGYRYKKLKPGEF